MSDTPLADALKDYYCFSHLDWYYLCCEVERENAKLHAEVKVTRQNYETYKRENAAMREVLAFYADPQSYGINGGNFHRVASDHGMKARAALARKEAQP